MTDQIRPKIAGMPSLSIDPAQLGLQTEPAIVVDAPPSPVDIADIVADALIAAMDASDLSGGNPVAIRQVARVAAIESQNG